MSKVSLSQQIEEVEHELRMREVVYPKLVLRKQKAQSAADMNMMRMRAVLDTLKWLQANEAKIKGALAA